jgi:DNA primase
MSEAQRPKYLNTSDNDVYHKGRHLFGAHLARSEAAKLGTVVVCEGYTDVIAMHQAGLRNTVGLMGTALTEDQLAELGRLAPIVCLALDADSAGQEAMLRAARLAAKRRLELRVVPLPAGSDPADIVQRDGGEAMATLVATAAPFVQFRVERLLASGDTSTPRGRDQLIEELRPVFEDLGAGATRLELEKLVAGRLQLPESMVASLLGRGRSGSTSGGTRPTGPLDARERSERAFLAICIALPREGREALASVDLDAHFTSQLTRRAAEHLRGHLDAPASGVDDEELATLLAELLVRASATPAHPAQLDVERLQLDLARIDREIAATRAAGSGGLTELSSQRRRVQVDLEAAVTEALEKTATPAQ